MTTGGGGEGQRGETAREDEAGAREGGVGVCSVSNEE